MLLTIGYTNWSTIFTSRESVCHEVLFFKDTRAQTRWYHHCDNTPRVVANTEPRNHMPPRGVTPTKTLEAGGARNRGPVHSGQDCILELGNNLINVWTNNQITWVQGNYRLPLSSRHKGAADPVVYSFNHVLDITACTTSLRKILNIGLGLYVHIFREIHLHHVWHCHDKWILDWISWHSSKNSWHTCRTS